MTSAPEMKVHRSLIKGLKLFDADRLRWLDEATTLGPVVALRMGPVKTWVITDARLRARRSSSPTALRGWTAGDSTAPITRRSRGEPVHAVRQELGASAADRALRRFGARRSKATRGDRRRSSTTKCTRFRSTTTVDLELVTGRIALSLAAWVHARVSASIRLGRTRYAHNQREVVRWVGRRTRPAHRIHTDQLSAARGQGDEDATVPRPQRIRRRSDRPAARRGRATTTCSARYYTPVRRGERSRPTSFAAMFSASSSAGNETTGAALVMGDSCTALATRRNGRSMAATIDGRAVHAPVSHRVDAPRSRRFGASREHRTSPESRDCCRRHHAYPQGPGGDGLSPRPSTVTRASGTDPLHVRPVAPRRRRQGTASSAASVRTRSSRLHRSAARAGRDERSACPALARHGNVTVDEPVTEDAALRAPLR